MSIYVWFCKQNESIGPSMEGYWQFKDYSDREIRESSGFTYYSIGKQNTLFY